LRNAEEIEFGRTVIRLCQRLPLNASEALPIPRSFRDGFPLEFDPKNLFPFWVLQNGSCLVHAERPFWVHAFTDPKNHQNGCQPFY